MLFRSFSSQRSSDSVFDEMMLASGKYAGVLFQRSKIWDYVGTQVIVEEAGGKFTDFYGKPIDYSKALATTNENYTLCAALPSIYKQLQEIIHSFDSSS